MSGRLPNLPEKHLPWMRSVKPSKSTSQCSFSLPMPNHLPEDFKA